MEVTAICETSQIYYLTYRRPMTDVLGSHLKDLVFLLVHRLNITYLCERPAKNPSIWKESLTWIVPRIRSVRGVNLEGWHLGRRHWGVGDDGRIGNHAKRLNAKEVIFPEEKREFIFQWQMDESNFWEEIRTWEHPPWYGIDQFKERVILTFLENQKVSSATLKTHFRVPGKR